RPRDHHNGSLLPEFKAAVETLIRVFDHEEKKREKAGGKCEQYRQHYRPDGSRSASHAHSVAARARRMPPGVRRWQRRRRLKVRLLLLNWRILFSERGRFGRRHRRNIAGGGSAIR